MVITHVKISSFKLRRQVTMVFPKPDFKDRWRMQWLGIEILQFTIKQYHHKMQRWTLNHLLSKSKTSNFFHWTISSSIEVFFIVLQQSFPLILSYFSRLIVIFVFVPFFIHVQTIRLTFTCMQTIWLTSFTRIQLDWHHSCVFVLTFPNSHSPFKKIFDLFSFKVSLHFPAFDNAERDQGR